MARPAAAAPARTTWPFGQLLGGPRLRAVSGPLLGLVLGLASATLSACFNPPADAVLFACTPDAPACRNAAISTAATTASA